MPKSQQFTPDTWRDQQRMLSEGQHTEDLGTALLLFVFGAAVLAFLGAIVWLIWGIFR